MITKAEFLEKILTKRELAEIHGLPCILSEF